MSAVPPAPDAVAPGAQPPPTEAGLLAQVRALWEELLAAVQAQLELAALEARQALVRVVTMLALALLGVALVATAWLGLIGAAVLFLIDLGVSGPVSMLIASAASIVAIVLCVVMLKRVATGMPFARTLRSLRGTPPQAP